MPNVAQILKSKLDDPQAAKRIAQAPVITIDAKSSVFEAVKMMAQHQIGALIVTEGSEGKIAGIITERDYARKIVLLDRSSKSTAVGEIMTQQVLHVLAQLAERVRPRARPPCEYQRKLAHLVRQAVHKS